MAKIVPPSTLIRYSTTLIFIYVVFAILSTELHAHMSAERVSCVSIIRTNRF